MRNGYVDVHSHILPGVDDGAKSLEESMEMLKTAYEEGIRTIIATPHFAARKNQAGNEKLHVSYELMKKVMKKEFPEMQIHLGNEIYYSDAVVDEIKGGKALTLADSKYVLVEFSPRVTYTELYQAVRKLVSARLRPIIAHVERYGCVVKEMDLIDELVEQGAYLQMNSQSMFGGILDENARWCKKLLKQGYIHFIGTDSHDNDERAPLMKEAYHWVEKKCGREMAEDLFGGNAKKVLVNEYIEV